MTRAEEIGLHVHGVVSDMGSANRAMWKAFGVNVGRFSTVSNSCQYSCDEKRKLFFFHDSPHALKNLKEGFLNNEFFTIPQSFVDRYALPSNKVCADHFSKLISEQESFLFKPAHKLQAELLEKKRHFLKMRVNNATNVMSHDVSSALQLLADEIDAPELKTTSWFVGMVAKWFQIMTSRGSLSSGKFASRKVYKSD